MKMNELEQIIQSTFGQKYFDKESKKRFKQIVKELKLDKRDLNLITKKAFELYRTKSTIDTHVLLIDWLETFINIVNDLNNDILVVEDIKFSPNDNCQKGIIDFIDNAKQNIKICVFTISDNEISDKIIEKFEQNVDVKIITDNEKVFDMGSDIRKFVEIGLKVKVDKTPHHMHHKFAITDDKLLLTGSYNWTRSAEERNYENIIVTDQRDLTKAYIKEFDKLWDKFERLK